MHYIDLVKYTCIHIKRYIKCTKFKDEPEGLSGQIIHASVV